MTTLNLGLLVDSLQADKHVEELALWCKRQPDINLLHLVVHPRRRHRPPPLPARAAFQVIVSVERMLLRWRNPHTDHHPIHDLTDIIDQVVHIRSGGDLRKVKALDLDVLIDCGSGMPGGELLRASRLGVISFVHGGFWECYHRRPQTSFLIQRLTADSDRGELLAKGSFKTLFYYSLNEANVRKKCVAHLKQVLKKVAATRELQPAQRTPSPASDALFRAPNLVQCVVYGCKLAKRIAVKAIGRLLRLRERFGISVLAGRWDQPPFWRRTAASLPRGRYWADPFLYTRGGRTFCFVEDLVHKTNKGHITALEIIGAQIVDRGIALQEPFHLSFPFLFEFQGQLYMCPESSASRQIRIYRCTEFPLRWELAKTLMEGVSAADAMLFEKGGRWWMLANIDEAETGDHCSELYLFSADSPLSSTWVPHPQNPILVDSIGGRNGGLITDGEKLFRLGQCQAFDQYGHSLRAYEIKEISESRYAEQLVAEIKPDFRKGIRGTHHLSTDGRTTVIDHAWVSFAS